MEKEKQIEELATIIANKAFERAHEIDGDENLADIVATELYEKGYRKASDVAREIFEEIIEALVDERIEEERKANSALEAQDTGSYEVYSYAEDKLGTLITALNIYKKKCTEDWK